jgi:hypothetical protein
MLADRNLRCAADVPCGPIVEPGFPLILVLWASVKANPARLGVMGIAFEDKEAKLGLLLTRMQNEPQDLHELYEVIRQKLNELKAYGMPLPEDLVQFELDLEAEFAADLGDKDARAWTR